MGTLLLARVALAGAISGWWHRSGEMKVIKYAHVDTFHVWGFGVRLSTSGLQAPSPATTV